MNREAYIKSNMCGIAGYIARKGELIQNDVISRMTDTIRHRGPDDEGFVFVCENEILPAGGIDTPAEVWNVKTDYSPSRSVESCKSGYSPVALGHRRLSILDLTPTGHQPMSYENGRYWIVFNGEIYNYQEIRTELAGLGYGFHTRSDTETILAAYSMWGEHCLERFAGMWSFAIYDRTKRELFLSRDRYGIKPFYYYFSPEGNFYFASEIKQFTVLDQWTPEMNPQRVYDQLVYSFTDHTDETMFKRVFQLPGGTFIRTSVDDIKPDYEGRIRSKKWYNVHVEPFKGTFEEASVQFREHFGKAVSEHLYADVPVGTALSGGLDSSAIVCEVNRILRSHGDQTLQKTFSSCTVHEKYNEKKWMDVIVNHTKVDASFVYPEPEDIFRLTPDLIWIHDEPYQSQSAFLAYHVFRSAREKGVKVLLNGQGADEYLGGYGQFTTALYAGMVRKIRIKPAIVDIRHLSREKGISELSVYSDVALQLLPDRTRRCLTYLHVNSGSVRKLINHKALGINPTHPYDVIPVKYNSVPEISEHLTFYSTLPKYLRWEDRNSMANSVEARVPFLDHRLVEFAFNLPDDYLEKRGITKRVMREAFIGLLPEVIRLRKDKMGFATPEEVWVRQGNTKLFRDKVEKAVESTGGIVKPDAIDYFNDIASGKTKFDYTYWRIILFAEWMQKFGIKTVK